MHPSRSHAHAPAWLALVLALHACGVGDGRHDEGRFMRLAKEHLQAHDSKAAIIDLKNALRQDGDLGEARYLLGQALLDTGQFAAAVVELQKAVDLQYLPDTTVPALARALVALGEPSRLIQAHAETVLDTPAAMADLRTSLAQAHAARGDLNAARAALAAAVQAVHSFAPARILGARLLALEQRPAEALAEVEIALQGAPDDASAWVLQADLLRATGAAADRVVGAYRKAVARDPKRTEAHVGLTLALMAADDAAGAQAALVAMKAALPEHARTLYLEGAMALQRGDLARARTLSDTLRRLHPTEPDQLRLAGMVALRSGQLDKAEEYFSNALQSASGDSSLRRMLAITQLRAAQPEQAIATLAPLVNKGRADAELLSLNALAQGQAGDIAGAHASHEKAARLAAGNPRVREAMAYSRLGRTASDQQALAELRAVAATDAGTSADLALVGALMVQRDLAAAAKAIDALQRKQPAAPLPWVLRGRLAEASGDAVAARSAYERAVHLAPVDFTACAALAALELREHRAERAQQLFESLLQRDPHSVPARLSLAALYDRQPGGSDKAGRLLEEAVKTDPTLAGTRVALVDHHLQARNAKRAQAVAQEGLAAMADQPALLDALGRANLAAGDRERALATFRQLADQRPTSPGPLVSVARVQLALKDTTGAHQSLSRALTLRPGHVPAVQGLIEIELARGGVDAALALTRQLQKLRPDDPIGLVLEGQVCSRSRRWDRAVDAHRAALKMAPRRSDLSILLHTALAAANRNDEAERHAQAWRRQHPKDPMFLMHLGEAALARHDWAGAEPYFESVIRLDGQHAPALNNLAWVWLQLGKPGAVRAAERASTLAPQRAEFADTLAMALAADHRTPEALTASRRAVELNPADPQLRLNLARLGIRAGDKAVAREQLDRLATLGQAFPQHEEVKALQKSL